MITAASNRTMYMNSQILIVLVHIFILAGIGVWAIRQERTRWLLILLPLVVAGLSWWWIRDPAPRDGPDWVIVVMVALYALGTVAMAKWAARVSRSFILHFAMAFAGGLVVVLPAAILAFIAWGVATAF